MEADEKYLRKQYLLSAEQVRKIERLRTRGDPVGATEIVRRAIDAYDPDEPSVRAEDAAALDAMEQALQETRAALSAIRERVAAQTAPEMIAERERGVADEIRAHYAEHPEALDALGDMLFGSDGGRDGRL
ncbi:hypothetical protein J2T57_001538 [Natronocella acetinitrilica]|uniref:Uncharacterized protein n=1 Tax=Natronocella acetinitrilica TaxID=414046 RepID=A0AAE3KBA7_9GAMM|nr:hypothetical protein [Natronocella acetinitrilica]MCP1674436.1 hypothetical protein [Natronocella acetinitrilica]